MSKDGCRALKSFVRCLLLSVLLSAQCLTAAYAFHIRTYPFFSARLDSWHEQRAPVLRRNSFIVSFADNAGTSEVTIHVVKSDKSGQEAAAGTLRFFKERGLEISDLGEADGIYGFSASDSAGKLVSVLMRSEDSKVATIYIQGDFKKAVSFLVDFYDVHPVLPIPAPVSTSS